MNISESTFYIYVSSATNPEGSGIFEMVQDDLSVAKSFVMSMLGTVLYDKLTAAQDGDLSPLFDTMRNAERYICLAAFDRAIPSLDLVLTPTGFGVVSNANVAPASADRVARLARKIRDLKEVAFDDLLDSLRGNYDWCRGEIAKRYFRSLVWQGAQMKHFGYPNEYRTKLAEMSTAIAEAERSLIHIISPEQHDEFTAYIRERRESLTIAIAIDLALAYIYSYNAGDKASTCDAKGALVSYLDSHIDAFPAYQSSSAYRANHFKPYENGEKDTCFFFG